MFALPTSPFTILEPQDQEIGKFYAVQERRFCSVKELVGLTCELNINVDHSYCKKLGSTCFMTCKKILMEEIIFVTVVQELLMFTLHQA